MNQIIPNLWFNDNAQEAVDFYLSVFKDSKLIDKDEYTAYGKEAHGHNEGDLVTIAFELNGTRFVAINGGPTFTLNPSVSFLVECKDQEEIDYYWEKLSANPEFEQCGWLQDKFGLSWQIAPKRLNEMLKNGSREQRENVTKAYMNMKKFDLAELEEAYKENG